MTLNKKPTLLLAIIAVIGVVSWWAWRVSFVQSYIVAPFRASLTVKLNTEFRNPTYEQHFKLSGSTSIPSHITLENNRDKLAEADTDGTFSFDVDLRPGTNELSVIATTTLGWHELAAEDGVTINYEPVKPSAPVLMPYPGTVNTPKIHIKGEADPNIELTIRAEKLRPASVQTNQAEQPENSNSSVGNVAVTSADEDGVFGADIELPEEGGYRVTAKSKNKQDQESYSSNALEVKYDKGFYPRVPQFTRSTEISIGYREVRTKLEATLPNDDPRITGLLTGKLSTPEFIWVVFGYLTINEQGLLSDIAVNGGATYVVGNKDTTVKFSALETGSNLALPSYNGRLLIQRIFIRTAPQHDSLKVIIRDYSLRSLTPFPSSLSGNEATWTGENAEQAGEGIIVELSSEPSSDPLRLLQLTPRAMLPRRAAVALSFIKDALATIPFIWLLWLWRRKNTRELPLESSSFESTASRFMALALIPPTLNAVSSDWPIFRAFFPQYWQDSEALFYAENLVVVGSAFALLLLITSRLKHPVARFALTILSKGLLKAWVLVSLLYVFLYIIYRFGVSGYPAIVAFPVLMWFLSRSLKWIKLMITTPETGITTRVRKREWLILLVVAAILTYPTDNILFHLYTVPTWQKVFVPLQQFFSDVSKLAPYVLIPLIFVFLRRVDPTKENDVAETNLAISLSLGALLFSSYLVGIGPSWFWLPIPFLLSLYLYPRLVLLPAEKQTAVAKLVREIRAQRGTSIRAMKDRANSRQMQEALAKLEKKFNAGDLALSDYETRSKQIEDYLQKEEAPWSPNTTLKTKDLILSVGPWDSNWENAWWAAKKSLYLLVPLLTLYLFVFLLKDIQPFYSYIYLWFGVRVATFMLDGLVGALFFGFFFNWIRGSSGLKKGMNVSIAVILCLLPSWIAPLSSSSVTNLIALLFRAGQTFLFFAILGIWAFDYKTYRDALGEQFEWKKFAKFGDMPGATAFISVTLTSLGVALTTVLTGQFTSIVTQIVRVALPTIQVPVSK